MWSRARSSAAATLPERALLSTTRWGRALHDLLELRQLVARDDHVVLGLRTDPLVLLMGQAQRGRAVGVGAFADELALLVPAR